LPPGDEALVRLVLERHGLTYAEEAGIQLEDKPAPLFQLLTLALLLSARISAAVATTTAKELFDAGYTTPQAMSRASWRARVNALGRGGYRRYDERTSTMLGEAADHVIHRWHSDLRRLHTEAGDDPQSLTALLTEFKGIGPVGASIFLREAQAVWPRLYPYADTRVERGAERVGLPPSAQSLARIAHTPEAMAELSAALVRLSLDTPPPRR
jgi:endonuclease III